MRYDNKYIIIVCNFTAHNVSVPMCIKLSDSGRTAMDCHWNGQDWVHQTRSGVFQITVKSGLTIDRQHPHHGLNRSHRICFYLLFVLNWYRTLFSHRNFQWLRYRYTYCIIVYMDTGYYVTPDIHTLHKNARTVFPVGTNMSVIDYYLNNWICLL